MIMMWLILAIITVGFLVILRKRSIERENADQFAEPHNKNVHEVHPLPTSVVDVEEEDEEELIAVITAAIEEFTGTSEFEVVRITPRAGNWLLTGRQNLLRGRS